VTLLAAKLLLSPLCVVAVSLAGRRWGVAVAGLLGGLPVVAGPILLVETLLHGHDFGADAAAGTLLGLAALTAFVVVYARLATAAGPIPSLRPCFLCTARRRPPTTRPGWPAWSQPPEVEGWDGMGHLLHLVDPPRFAELLRTLLAQPG
jgi:hypothetical protein